MPGDLKLNPKDGQRYAWIPPGKFTMGCSPGDSECQDWENPAHEVEISKGFWLGQTAVTVGAWKRYRSATGKPPLPTMDTMGRNNLNEASGDENMPIVFISWDETSDFCHWGGGRLPTEAEWEHAARAGSTGSRHGSLDSIAWHGDNSGKRRIDSAQFWTSDRRNYPKRLFENGNGAHPAGLKEPNAWKLYDMQGNVWQWVSDWYDEKYYAQAEKVDPHGPPSGTSRAVRGGSWFDFPRNVRVSFRGRYKPANRSFNIGCRCAWELP